MSQVAFWQWCQQNALAFHYAFHAPPGPCSSETTTQFPAKLGTYIKYDTVQWSRQYTTPLQSVSVSGFACQWQWSKYLNIYQNISKLLYFVWSPPW
jgi:hypothetical protein